MKERIILAYSGGLDTSVAIGWIAEATGAEVVAVAVDVGQGGESLETVRQRALDCGAVEAYVADARDEFAEQYCMPALKATSRCPWARTSSTCATPDWAICARVVSITSYTWALSMRRMVSYSRRRCSDACASCG